jgi:hypothetical protein
MVDLFALRATDTKALAEVIDALHAHCDTGQVEHFLGDFSRWHRIQGRRVPQQERDDAFIELQQWQQFINGLQRQDRPA